MNLYMLNLNGTEAGPFTEQQLRAMWLTGGVTVNTDWRMAPQGEWRSGAELPERMELVPPKPKDTKILIALQTLSLLALVGGLTLLAWSQFGNTTKSEPLPMKTVWEYKTVDCEPHKITGIEIHDDESKSFDFDEKEIADAGKDGWELCGVFPEIETVFPTEIHAQSLIEPNVRIERVTLIFKRSDQEVDDVALSVRNQMAEKH